MSNEQAQSQQACSAAPKKKGFKLHFPTAVTVLFIVMVFAQILTYVVPAGNYSKLLYNKEEKTFVITTPDGETE